MITQIVAVAVALVLIVAGGLLDPGAVLVLSGAILLYVGAFVIDDGDE